MKKITRTLIVLFAAAASLAATAQSPFDDLYYSPSKAAKQKKQKQEQLNAAKDRNRSMTVADYPGADSYSEGSSRPLNVDVDTYNRRTSAPLTKADSIAASGEDFSYTRRIERYHNPEVVTSTGDNDLIDYYYTTSGSSPEINVYLIDNDPFYWGPSWRYPGYRYNYWGPTWSFGWAYDPWYDWGWANPWYGPSWGWGWNWGPGWRPAPPLPPRPVGPSHGWASNSPGASRPHRPSTSIGASGGHASSIGTRPGSSRPSWSNPAGITRPGNNGNAYRPGNNGNYRPGNNNGTVNQRPASTPNRNPSNVTPSNNSRRGSSSSNYRSTTPSSRSNSGSYRAPSGGSRSYGGGSRTGGGGARGRR